MGLMQRAYETYEALSSKYVGVYDETQKEVFAPVSHIVTKADIEITLDLDGHFLAAKAIDKDERKVIIPVTEESAGRTSAPTAHPLCEQLGYLCGTDKRKYQLYIDQLSEWEKQARIPSLQAVLKYVEQKTIWDDLIQASLLKLDEHGKLKNEKNLVKWVVLGCDEPDCSKDQALMESFISFYQTKLEKRQEDFCMLNGNMAQSASQHPKGVVAINGNAKLISTNDSSGFTYRGRFEDDRQAVAISYDASQKAHNALRWIIANQGVSFGSRMFICWNPQGIKLPSVKNAFLFDTEPVLRYSDYKSNLQKTLNGWKTDLPGDAMAIIAAFDAATTGRLAVTYYNELLASDFLDRLCFWDESCCWINGTFGIQSPALYNIIAYAFGDRRNESLIECDERILRQQMQRLIACRIEKAPISTDIVSALTIRCGSLHLYKNDLRNKLLFTTCAVIRKYRMERKKEEWELALEAHRKDRSYQYGRLLAVMEKIERDTYDSDEKREPNAIRLQSIFVQRPQSAVTTVMEQLKKAYYSQLRPGTRVFYDRLIGEIMNEISKCEGNWNSPLEDTYLMGYYLQKRELYQAKEKEHKEEEK